MRRAGCRGLSDSAGNGRTGAKMLMELIEDVKVRRRSWPEVVMPMIGTDKIEVEGGAKNEIALADTRVIQLIAVRRERVYPTSASSSVILCQGQTWIQSQ